MPWLPNIDNWYPMFKKELTMKLAGSLISISDKPQYSCHVLEDRENFVMTTLKKISRIFRRVKAG